MRSKSTITVFAAVLAVLGRELVAFVQGLAFWTAVVLPLVYLALLVAGSPTVSDPSAVAELATLNVVSLVLGHGYGDP
ncbi:hypothetical protein [Halobacterium wangiae]|uniref:hypothetical protein n=1 Tax=Halobacterium wangiae TaxID=2902623 RepID=UPI001E5B856F|nr:hypothetical protein [Halobacterium wangiae]